MACEVGTSPFPDSPFDDNWANPDSSIITANLDAIRDFNTNFDQQNSGSINPSLTYSNPSTPQAHNQNAYHFNATINADLSQTLSPAPMYEAYPSSFNDPQASPYFPSMELDSGPMYPPPALRNQQYSHRRSVSEPPGMPEQPSMVFHRDEHWIGRPKAAPLKSLPKHKCTRSHPYPASARKSTRHQPSSVSHPQAMEQQHQQHQHGFRPNMQRAQTQPARQYAPTSAPMILSPQQYMNMRPPPHHHQQQQQQQANPYFHHTPPPAPMMPDSIIVSKQSTSRICTPTPIDPTLSEPAASPRSQSRSAEGEGEGEDEGEGEGECDQNGNNGNSSNGHDDGNRSNDGHRNITKTKQTTTTNNTTLLNIPITIDELRELIFDAVQQAVRGGTEHDGPAGGDLEPGHYHHQDEDGDKSLVEGGKGGGKGEGGRGERQQSTSHATRKFDDGQREVQAEFGVGKVEEGF